MKRILLILIICILLISSCDFQPTEDERLPTECPPICASGYKGVEIDILSPLSGSTIRSRSFTPEVFLYDVGQSDADGMVCMTGLNENVFSDFSSCDCQDFDITLQDPRQYNFQETRVDFSRVTIDTDKDSQGAVTFITRYKYITYGSFELCLTPDPAGEKDCRVDGNKAGISSGAPVSVDFIYEEISSPSRNAEVFDVILTIEASISDTSGYLIPYDDVKNPSCFIINEDNEVLVETDIILFKERHDCGYMVFKDGENKATTTCTITILSEDLIGRGNKQQTGYVQLDYGFEEIQSSNFDIVKSQVSQV